MEQLVCSYKLLFFLVLFEGIEAGFDKRSVAVLPEPHGKDIATHKELLVAEIVLPVLETMEESVESSLLQLVALPLEIVEQDGQVLLLRKLFG